MKIKKFNLEEAKRGDRVVTRDGREVRILCFDYKSVFDDLIIGLVKDIHGMEHIKTFHSKGNVYLAEETKDDLFMWDNSTPFDLEDAKDGDQVCTNRGHKVTFFKFDGNGKYPIIGMINDICNDGFITRWDNTGVNKETVCHYDLVME